MISMCDHGWVSPKESCVFYKMDMCSQYDCDPRDLHDSTTWFDKRCTWCEFWYLEYKTKRFVSMAEITRWWLVTDKQTRKNAMLKSTMAWKWHNLLMCSESWPSNFKPYSVVLLIMPHSKRCVNVPSRRHRVFLPSNLEGIMEGVDMHGCFLPHKLVVLI